MNIKELTAKFEEIALKLEAGTIDLKVAAEMNNGLGKSARVHIAAVAYESHRAGNPNARTLDFFEAGTTERPQEKQ